MLVRGYNIARGCQGESSCPFTGGEIHLLGRGPARDTPDRSGFDKMSSFDTDYVFFLFS